MRMKTEERTNDELRAAFSYLRKSRKVRLKDLAEAGGCTTRHLSAILSEKDRRGMSGDLAKAMAAYFGLTYDLFLTLGQLIMAGVPGEEASKRVTPITGKDHIEQSILVGGTAEVGHPAFGESMSRWLAGKTENERYEIAKAGLVSLGTPSSAVISVPNAQTITFDAVSQSFPQSGKNTHEVLREVSFTAAAGEIISITL